MLLIPNQEKYEFFTSVLIKHAYVLTLFSTNGNSTYLSNIDITSATVLDKPLHLNPNKGSEGWPIITLGGSAD